jgi:hypothetical protein
MWQNCRALKTRPFIPLTDCDITLAATCKCDLCYHKIKLCVCFSSTFLRRVGNYKLQTCGFSFATSLCLSVRLYVACKHSRNLIRFSWNLTLWISTQICRHISVSVQNATTVSQSPCEMTVQPCVDRSRPTCLKWSVVTFPTGHTRSRNISRPLTVFRAPWNERPPHSPALWRNKFIARNLEEMEERMTSVLANTLWSAVANVPARSRKLLTAGAYVDINVLCIKLYWMIYRLQFGS